MNISNVINYIKKPAFLAGLLFLIVNLHVSHQFYHANSYKIFVILVGISCLFLIQLLLYRPGFNKLFIRHFALVSLPLIATIPGILIYQGGYNYNFQYELVSNIILILWVVYLLLGINSEKDFNILLQIIGITIIYVCLRGVLEFYGWDPLLGDTPVDRIKVTFGNINYLAGFIIVLIPVFLMLAVPLGKEKGTRWIKHNLFYIIVSFSGLITLYLTKTRAAWGASLVSIIFIAMITFLVFYPKYRKKLSAFMLVGIFIGIGILVFLYLNHDKSGLISEITIKLRLKSIFTGEAFWGRLLSWETAYDSILSSPFIGFGLGASYNLFFLFKNPSARLFWGEQSYNHVHSEILEFTQEAGIIGVIILVFFWAILFRQIYLIITKSENLFYRKLALGIAGGLIAYGIQSLFSVAPRMMVTKFPVYTLIAASFILYIAYLKESGQSQIKKENSKSLQVSINAIFIGLTTISLLIYIPWALRQKNLTDYLASGQSLYMVEKFEKTTDSWRYPDIYSLFYLANAQINYGRIQQFGNTIDKISEIIPHYRQVDYWRGVKAFRSKDIKQAERLLKEHQLRDRYYLPTINMLVKLALFENNEQLFFEQIQLITRLNLANSNIFPKSIISKVPIKQQKMGSIFAIEKTQTVNYFVWQSDFIHEVFELSRSNLNIKKPNKNIVKQFTQKIFKDFSVHPLFKIDIRKKYQSDQKIIPQNMALYFNLEQRQKTISQLMEKKYQDQLKNVKSRAQATELNTQYQEQRDKILQPYQEKMTALQSDFMDKTEWEKYIQKRKFIINTIRSLHKIAFNIG